MDPLAFDRRVRFLAHASSRRRLFAALATFSGAVAGRAPWPAASAPTPSVAAPQPAHRKAKSAKRRCLAQHGRYFGPGEACPCAALCHELPASGPAAFPCPIGPDCICYASATGGAICGKSYEQFHTGCATNADCIQLNVGVTLCVLMPCGHSDGQPCGPGKPPCKASQACLNGRCRFTSCVEVCG